MKDREHLPSADCWCEPEVEYVPRFADEPNVRSVIQALAGEDEDAAQEAIDRISKILGLDGWQGTKMFGRYEIGEGIGEQ